MIEKNPKTDLFKKILYCQNILDGSDGCGTHPCKQVIEYQKNRDDESWQLPEPWNGHIHTAPVLVISSNPSIYDEDYAPRKTYSMESAFDFYHNRFTGKHPKNGLPYVLNDTQVLKQSGNYGKPVRFFNCVRKRVQEVFDYMAEKLDQPKRMVRPGIDFSIVDVVRCKSQREKGVSEAMSTCFEMHMPETLRLSPAPCILVFGKKASNEMARNLLGLDSVHPGTAYTVHINGIERTLCFLGHPSSSLPQKFEHVIHNNQRLLEYYVSNHKEELSKWFA